MQPTTGLILRRITQTQLSVSAHKLATIILDGIAWKDGYNGLTRGTAAFTLADLAERMGVSRQYLSTLLAELEASQLKLVRWKPNGKFAPWLFRFEAFEGEEDAADGSAVGDTSPSIETQNKTIFLGQITIDECSNVFRTRWAEVIKAAKAALPCWNADTQLIWERFLAFNRGRGNNKVPAGYLLGFMRKWRNAPDSVGQRSKAPFADQPRGELQALVSAAPSSNRQFHEADLCRVIGQAAYQARVLGIIRRFRCPKFTAALAVHGQAVLSGEIAR